MKRTSQGGKPPPGRAAAIYQQGLAAFETKRYLDAIDLLGRIAGQRHLPGTLATFYLSQAHMHEGLKQLQAGCYAAAAEHLSTARRLNPQSADLWQRLAACHVGRGRFDLAAAEFERASESGQPDAAVAIRLAHALARDGQFEKAVSALAAEAEASPQRADLRLQLGLLHASVEDFGRAANVLERAAALAPENPDIRQHLGLAYGALGKLTPAVEQLAIAQRKRPYDAYLALLLTMAVQAANQSGASLRIEPTLPRPRTLDIAAVDRLGEIITNDPEFVEAFISLPESDVDPVVFAELAGILERALERHPDYADLHHHCSRVYARLGRTDQAIDRARKAVEINPRYVQGLIQLGRLYARTQRGGEAIDRLREAVAGGGDYPDVHCLLGDLYRDDGRKREACDAYRRALELNDGYERAREALDALLTA